MVASHRLHVHLHTLHHGYSKVHITIYSVRTLIGSSNPSTLLYFAENIPEIAT